MLHASLEGNYPYSTLILNYDIPAKSGTLNRDKQSLATYSKGSIQLCSLLNNSLMAKFKSCGLWACLVFFLIWRISCYQYYPNVNTFKLVEQLHLEIHFIYLCSNYFIYFIVWLNAKRKRKHLIQLTKPFYNEVVEENKSFTSESLKTVPGGTISTNIAANLTLKCSFCCGIV